MSALPICRAHAFTRRHIWLLASDDTFCWSREEVFSSFTALVLIKSCVFISLNLILLIYLGKLQVSDFNYIYFYYSICMDPNILHVKLIWNDEIFLVLTNNWAWLQPSFYGIKKDYYLTNIFLGRNASQGRICGCCPNVLFEMSCHPSSTSEFSGLQSGHSDRGKNNIFLFQYNCWKFFSPEFKKKNLGYTTRILKYKPGSLLFFHQIFTRRFCYYNMLLQHGISK